jgi:hypothetical protein
VGTSKFFVTGSSEMENKPFIGFESRDIIEGINWKFRIAKIVSTFTVIGETLELIKKKRLSKIS